MGRKVPNKTSTKKKSGITLHGNVSTPVPAGVLKLPPNKRSELNQLTDKLLKVAGGLQANSNVKACWDTHLEIEKLLSKIIAIEADITPQLPLRNQETIKTFTEWFTENGGFANGVEIHDFSNYGFGFRAAKPLSEGDIIIEVPRKLMICYDTASTTVLKYLMENDPIVTTMPNVTLALMLLLERLKGDSFYNPYISMLPSTYDTVLYFPSSHLNELRGSPTFERALKQCRNIARQYAYFYCLFQKNYHEPVHQFFRENFPYDLYRWAASTVMTRQNLIPSSEGGAACITCLIPYWDMSNHIDTNITTDYSPEDNKSTCYASKSYSEGEQVFISYGQRPNSQLFLHNGFILEENSADEFPLRLGVSSSDPLHDLRVSLLSKLSIVSPSDFPLLPSQQPLHPNTLAFLRIFSMDKEQLDQWKASDKVNDLKHPDCAMDTSVDKKMWAFLITRLKLLIASYPSTKEADEQMLDLKNLPSTKRLAIQMRLTEKRILHNALNYAVEHSKE